MTVIGVLLPSPKRPPRPPRATVFGRAALRLRSEGIRVLIGAEGGDGRLHGQEATRTRWTPLQAPPEALVHRFPDHTRPLAWRTLMRALPDVPLTNPERTVRLCRDKLALQHLAQDAGLPMPEVTGDVSCFSDALSDWGTAFLKPRHGAAGADIRRVHAGDFLGLLPDGAWVLQRALSAPEGWAGWSVRILVQRQPEGWVRCPAALRRHRSDPVVNAARGAEVVPADDHLGDATLGVLQDHAHQLAELVASLAPATGELGIDFVIDADMRPWLIEANAKPKGRLASLAVLDPDRFGAAHDHAAERLLRWAAHLAVAGRTSPDSAPLLRPKEDT